MPPELWRKLSAHLQAILEIPRDTVARYIPERLNESERVSGLAATVMWLKVEELLEDFAPVKSRAQVWRVAWAGKATAYYYG